MTTAYFLRIDNCSIKQDGGYRGWSRARHGWRKTERKRRHLVYDMSSLKSLKTCKCVMSSQ